MCGSAFTPGSTGGGAGRSMSGASMRSSARVIGRMLPWRWPGTTLVSADTSFHDFQSLVSRAP
jgi:hypothetical protein